MKVKVMLGLVVLVIAAVALNWLYFKTEPEQNVIAENVATSTPSETPPASQPQAIETAPGIKTYTNTPYRYSFSYPSAWTLAREESVIDQVNWMPSIISVHEGEGPADHRFSVTINRGDERLLKNDAPETEAITVGGVAATAYIFPNGYQCQDDPDCSFFLIPIQRNGAWYEIVAANDARTLDAYRAILASFKFTQ